jgi:hypothetical protein
MPDGRPIPVILCLNKYDEDPKNVTSEDEGTT